MRPTKRTFLFLSAFILMWLAPTLAFAQAAGTTTADSPVAAAARAFGAALAIGLSAIGAGYAQAHIGAAGAGALAERPEAATYAIVLTALPEIVALLGFVMAFLINSAK